LDKRLFWATFLTVFLAEVGDKTQLAAMTATAKSGALWTVFFAASLALVCATAVGVTVGAALFKLVPPSAVRIGAGLAFIGVGIWVLVKG
jgi:putative Ca2+/H+ antiporter (TMEM165/GDT1 family)